jgi:D-beta-D-heptose 7-phosphate kinase/D-beta-D-heptose 1-phosphate adenosyltransferase
LSNAGLAQVLEQIGKVRALVVGDLMLDHYVWGDCERISPEAPVPVLRVVREEHRAGGAGSVVANLATLDCPVSVVSVAGDDTAGDELVSILRDLRGPSSQEPLVDVSGIVRLKDHGTTQKTRLVARVQQLLRVDRDVTADIDDKIAAQLEQLALARLANVDVVLASDYGKGVLEHGLVQAVATAARARGIPVVVDPFRHADFARYKGATTITPNRKETENATGIAQVSRDSHEQASKKLIADLGLDFATITLDKDGIYLRKKNAPKGEIFPAKARAVYDVTGAGDMVLSVLGLVLGAKGDVEDAVRLANVASGLEVERVGVAPISRAEIQREVSSATPPALARKMIFEPTELLSRVDEARRQGKRIVFTNGCFDLMHAGHVRYFQDCRAQGDFLVVAVNTDDSIRRNKGPERPIMTLEERSTVLAGLAAIDVIIPFDETTPIALIEKVKPDVLVKGEDYKDKLVVGRDVVEASGGHVFLAPLWPGVSTTRMIERVAAASRNS